MHSLRTFLNHYLWYIVHEGSKHAHVYKCTPQAMANNWKRTERAMVLLVGLARDLTKLHSWQAKTSLMITRLQHHTGSVISEWVRLSRSLFDFDTMLRHLLLLTFLLVPQVLGNSIRIHNCESELLCGHFMRWYLKYNGHFEDNSRTKRFTKG